MPRSAIGYDGPIDFEGSVVQIAEQIARVVSMTVVTRAVSEGS